MNPSFRKVALIAATLGLLVSLFVALRPDDEATSQPTATDAPLATAPSVEPAPETTTAPATTAPPPVPDVITIRVAVGSQGVASVRRFSVEQGRKIELTVTSELADNVHLHGYDLAADVAPGSPARIEFTATAPGRFELELEERGLEIAELEVRP